MSRTQWTSRTVFDAVGEAGSVDLDEELVARAQLAGYGLAVEFND